MKKKKEKTDYSIGYARRIDPEKDKALLEFLNQPTIKITTQNKVDLGLHIIHSIQQDYKKGFRIEEAFKMDEEELNEQAMLIGLSALIKMEKLKLIPKISHVIECPDHLK